MHEMSLCQSLLEMIQDSQREENFSQVLTVELDIGSLAAVESEAMIFGFDVVTKNTVADGARLIVNSIAASGRCPSCGISQPMENLWSRCQKGCDALLSAETGRELSIKRLEVE